MSKILVNAVGYGAPDCGGFRPATRDANQVKSLEEKRLTNARIIIGERIM
jgi:hypothetical protein